MAYPISLDTISTLPSKVDNVTTVIAAHVNTLQGIVIELETKLGVDSSSVNTTIDYFLKHVSGAYRNHIHDGSSDDGPNIPGASITALNTMDSSAGQLPTLNLTGFTAITEKTILSANDLFVIEDTEDSNLKKKCKVAALRIGLVDLSTAQTIAGVKTLSDNMNFNKKQALGLCIENRTADPTGGDLVTGRIWFRTDIA